MVKTKQKMKIKQTQLKQRLLLVVTIAALRGSLVITPLVRADQYTDKINQLQAENNNNKQTVNQLQLQTNNYQEEINRLQAQIDAVRAQIHQNETKRDDLQNQIKIAEDELSKQKVLLAANIKAIYVEGQISTLEMLASSKDLSQFLDKQQYRETIQQKIKESLDKINNLRAQLKDQKSQVEKLLADQQSMNEQLSGSQAQQSTLLAYTEAQKNQFTAQIQTNNSKIAEVQSQQRAAYAKATAGGSRNFGSLGGFRFRNLSAQEYCGGGYSYCWAGFDQHVDDPWGFTFARECVHYTLDRVVPRRNDIFPPGHGNAGEWPYYAERAGFRVDQSPEVGAVAIASAEDVPSVGHAMLVEYIAGDGWVGVSQFNFDGRGHYSTMEVKSSSVRFVHFN